MIAWFALLAVGFLILGYGMLSTFKRDLAANDAAWQARHDTDMRAWENLHEQRNAELEKARGDLIDMENLLVIADAEIERLTLGARAPKVAYLSARPILLTKQRGAR